MPEPLAITDDMLQQALFTGSRSLSSAVVLLPAWRPEPCLLELVDGLLAAGLGGVVCVDDGSGGDYSALFRSLAERPRTVVLRHGVNLGKGRALKTGMNYIANHLSGCARLITVDADGQHTLQDILRVMLASSGAWTAGGEATQEGGSSFTLGVRSFAGPVPLRSRLGNGLTCTLFSFLTGVRIRDTQSGLRCFSCDLLPTLLQLKGERYEFEMTALTHLCRLGVKPLQVQIETVYLDHNQSSHFRPIRDSVLVYAALARSALQRPRTFFSSYRD